MVILFEENLQRLRIRNDFITILLSAYMAFMNIVSSSISQKKYGTTSFIWILVSKVLNLTYISLFENIFKTLYVFLRSLKVTLSL